jgi:hypothetical protein
MDLENIALVEYLVIEIADVSAENLSNASSKLASLDSKDKNNNELLEHNLEYLKLEGLTSPLDNYEIKRILSFDAPATVNSSNNFGLYASEDLEIFTFYYKDIFKNIQTNYYTIRQAEMFESINHSDSKRHLKLLCKSIPNTWLSTHSTDFRYYLKQNQNEQLEVTPFDHTTKDDYINDYYNMTINISKNTK